MLKDRVAQIMQELELTPKSLAEALGVQRSGVSHILSGRNKPSLEFITRLLEKYPQVNHSWLLHGTGSMLESEPTPPPFTLPLQAENASKRVEQIVVFYTDGTCKRYVPEGITNTVGS